MVPNITLLLGFRCDHVWRRQRALTYSLSPSLDRVTHPIFTLLLSLLQPTWVLPWLVEAQGLGLAFGRGEPFEPVIQKVLHKSITLDLFIVIEPFENSTPQPKDIWKICLYLKDP